MESNDSNGYTAKDITVLSGPQGIRKRPAMYVGSTGSRGFTHLLYEIIDNSIDEAIAGYCHNITITLGREEGIDTAEVSDDGRGIPVDIMPKFGKPALEVIMTSIHAGGKFESKAYKVSGGLHGVGLTVVNSLSEYTIVTVRRDGKIYRQQFSRGQPVSSLEEIGTYDSGGTGTTIKFRPDREIFNQLNFDTIELEERLRDLSYLNKGITIKLIDTRDGERHEKVYTSTNGISDFLEYITEGKEKISMPIYISKTQETTEVTVIFQYVAAYNENIVSFVNKIKVPEGGTHITGFRAAITRAITNYIQRNPKKQENIQIEGDDVREGLYGIISIMLQNPEFEGQTKEKLGNMAVKSIVDSIVYAEFSRYLEENPIEASRILEKVYSAARARESARKARELSRKKSIFDGPLLSGKLADCTESNPEKTEIFIVEGDSAAGSSKQGRDRFYQAILPLRGKVLNVEKATEDKIFSNKELHMMVAAFGTGIKESFDPNKLRYNKIIILTDADVDGSHIRTLLMTFMYRYMRALIERGNVYIAQPPLYKITKGKTVKYAYSDSELNAAIKELGEPVSVQRYKGLGEMNPEQLWETTMDPKQRVLKKVSIWDVEKADAIFSTLMGSDVSARRKFLEEHSSEVSFLDV
ncbi:MAG: DNA gyrase subunit B [Candidatus Micrarchaeaceae archaeon]